MRRILFLLFLSLILGGRSKAQQDPVLDLQQTMPSEDSWWQFFGDSTLIRLIDKSVANNYNLQNAVKNIQLAKSRWRSQQGHFFPSFSASAQYTPEKSSLGIDHADNYYHIGQAGIEMNWEIDVFGNIRKGAKAQKEYYLASQEDYRGTMVSLASEVAMAYIRLRTYQQQLEVARNNLESQEEILRINEAKLAAGLTSNLTVAQSKGLWLQTKATLPGLEASVYSEVNTLAVLTGEYSDSLRQALLQVHPLPQGNPILMQGIPAELIRRRPDVRSAERTMDALAAAAGATRADWWPKFYLTGAIGTQAHEGSLFNGPGKMYSFMPQISWPIFHAGAITKNIKVQGARAEQLLAAYEQTVLTAVGEVRDALSDNVQEYERNARLKSGVDAAQSALDLANEKYANGLVDFTNVINAQSALASLSEQYVVSGGQISTNAVRLFKALGGGWQPLDEAARAIAEAAAKKK